MTVMTMAPPSHPYIPGPEEEQPGHCAVSIEIPSGVSCLPNKARGHGNTSGTF